MVGGVLVGGNVDGSKVDVGDADGYTLGLAVGIPEGSIEK